MKCMFGLFMRSFLYIHSFWFAGLGAGAPEGRAYKIEAQGGCTLLRLADFCDASRMMLAKIRALRQFSFGYFVRRTRRMKTARKNRCAIPLTRSKELFQPDARSDLPLLGPGLRPGRCGWVGSPEGVGRRSRNTLPPPLAQRSDKPNKKAPVSGRPAHLYNFCANEYLRRTQKNRRSGGNGGCSVPRGTQCVWFYQRFAVSL